MLQLSRVFWALTALFLLPTPGASGEGSFATHRRLRTTYSVSQTHSLTVREDALVDIVLTIVVHVNPGSTLSGIRKTILSEFGIQQVVGDVVATDASGRTLALRSSSNDEGWFRVEIDFAKAVDGNTTPDYTVNLVYTVSNGICTPAPDSNLARFDLPWAHRWVARVTDSRYEIAFANPSMDMGTVCLGTTGFRPRCGKAGLVVSGSKATHEVAGNLHGTYFDWAAPGASFRPCAGAPVVLYNFQNPANDQNIDQADQTEPQLLSQEESPKSAMSVGLAAFGSIFLLAGTACVCAHKGPVHSGARRKGSDGVEFEPGKKGKDKLELDLEDATTDSTVASVRESPTFAARRLLTEIGRTRTGSPLRRPTDTGAGLGDWDVPEEFEEEELYALNETLPEYSLRVSEHTPASEYGVENRLYGKPSLANVHGNGDRRTNTEGLVIFASPSLPLSQSRRRRDEFVDMGGIDLDVTLEEDSDDGEAVDPFEVQDDCGDSRLEDIGMHASVSMRTPAKPTMAIAPNGRTSPNGATSLQPLDAGSDFLRSAATKVALSTESREGSWEVEDEFDDQDVVAHNSILRVTPPVWLTQIGSEVVPALPDLAGSWEASNEFSEEDVMAHETTMRPSPPMWSFASPERTKPSESSAPAMLTMGNEASHFDSREVATVPVSPENETRRKKKVTKKKARADAASSAVAMPTMSRDWEALPDLGDEDLEANNALQNSQIRVREPEVDPATTAIAPPPVSWDASSEFGDEDMVHHSTILDRLQGQVPATHGLMGLAGAVAQNFLLPPAPHIVALPAQPPATSPLKAATVPSRCLDNDFGPFELTGRPAHQQRPFNLEACALPPMPPQSADTQASSWEAMDDTIVDEVFTKASPRVMRAAPSESSVI